MDTSKNSASMWPRLAVFCTVIAGVVTPVVSASTALAISHSERGTAENRRLVQDDESVPDEDNVSTKQVDKYIAVYTAMQKNHSVTVQQAASQQGLTVDEFRALEDKIQRNPIVHERVLDALKGSANGPKSAKSTNAQPQ